MPRKIPGGILDAYMKTGRAGVHLNALKAACQAFVETDPYSFTYKDDLKTQRHIVHIKLRDVPEELALIAGDFFYCLRSSLDQLVFGLAFKKGSPLPNHTQFPIYDRLDQDTRRRFRYSTRGVPAAAIRIIESLQPYQRPSALQFDPLWRLNEMCNLDKHRHIPTWGSSVELQVYKGREIPGLKMEALHDGGEVSVPLSLKSQMKLNPRPPIEVLFGDVHVGIQLTIGDITHIYEVIRNKILPRFAGFFK